MPYITVVRANGVPIIIRTSIIEMIEPEGRTGVDASSYLYTSTQGRIGVKEKATEIAAMIEEVEAPAFIIGETLSTDGPKLAHQLDMSKR